MCTNHSRQVYNMYSVCSTLAMAHTVRVVDLAMVRSTTCTVCALQVISSACVNQKVPFSKRPERGEGEEE